VNAGVGRVTQDVDISAIEGSVITIFGAVAAKRDEDGFENPINSEDGPTKTGAVFARCGSGASRSSLGRIVCERVVDECNRSPIAEDAATQAGSAAASSSGSRCVIAAATVATAESANATGGRRAAATASSSATSAAKATGSARGTGAGAAAATSSTAKATGSARGTR
jgi:hypothetical protein